MDWIILKLHTQQPQQTYGSLWLCFNNVISEDSQPHNTGRVVGFMPIISIKTWKFFGAGKKPCHRRCHNYESVSPHCFLCTFVLRFHQVNYPLTFFFFYLFPNEMLTPIFENSDDGNNCTLHVLHVPSGQKCFRSQGLQPSNCWEGKAGAHRLCKMISLINLPSFEGQ